ncbi:MAG: Unknown protein [uncultured Sulfurovum sp.]|uniref:Uncharacterized protein n=1 Tax=uncultured Sulfurovum sp. TaxID=269237 RepID=A0A6S6U3N2_9BACT|nr:MAG: Unknown protein [uncultured Sulfurovum sp.]
MNKNFLTFIVLVIVLVLVKFAYDKYCETKPEGCSFTEVEDNYLSDDHMDN